MCGIAGVASLKKLERVEDVLAAMILALKHRGPDGEGHAILSVGSSGCVGFAHTLLSTMGEATLSRQPIETTDGLLIFNGAIYNYLELAREIESTSGTIDKSCDTTVLIRGLDVFGFDFIQKLRGMFAFAYFDKRKRQLYLVRDPNGVKPLYYVFNGTTLAFGSEYKCLLPHFNSFTLNHRAIDQYLTLRYVPGNATLVSEINKILPGHALVFDMFENKLSERPHYRQGTIVPKTNDICEALTFAIDRRGVAAHEVAACLSGGLDSGLVCDFLSRRIRSLETYTLKIDGADETTGAQTISDALGIKNNQVSIIAPTIESFEKIIFHLDDPYGDPIIFALDSLFASIGQRHRIVVTGEGADELFSGYIHHRALAFLNLFPRWLYPTLRRALRMMSPATVNYLLPYAVRLGAEEVSIAVARVSKFLSDPNMQNFQSIFATFSFEDLINNRPFQEFEKSVPTLEMLRNLDLSNWLPNSQCFKLDKIAMKYGVEAREPFLDIDLMATVLKFPASDHFKIFSDKPVLRRAVSKKTRLPNEVVNTRKRSFFYPLNGMNELPFLNSLQNLVNDTITELHPFLKTEVIDEIVSRQVNSVIRLKKLFTAAAFSIWTKKVWMLRGRGILIG